MAGSFGFSLASEYPSHHGADQCGSGHVNGAELDLVGGITNDLPGALSCAIEGLVVPRWRTESGLECRHLVVMRGGLYSASVGFVFSDEARSRGHKRERAQLRTAIAR